MLSTFNLELFKFVEKAKGNTSGSSGNDVNRRVPFYHSDKRMTKSMRLSLADNQRDTKWEALYEGVRVISGDNNGGSGTAASILLNIGIHLPPIWPITHFLSPTLSTQYNQIFSTLLHTKYCLSAIDKIKAYNKSMERKNNQHLKPMKSNVGNNRSKYQNLLKVSHVIRSIHDYKLLVSCGSPSPVFQTCKDLKDLEEEVTSYIRSVHNAMFLSEGRELLHRYEISLLESALLFASFLKSAASSDSPDSVKPNKTFVSSSSKTSTFEILKHEAEKTFLSKLEFFVVILRQEAIRIERDGRGGNHFLMGLVNDLTM